MAVKRVKWEPCDSIPDKESNVEMVKTFLLDFENSTATIAKVTPWDPDHTKCRASIHSTSKTLGQFYRTYTRRGFIYVEKRYRFSAPPLTDEQAGQFARDLSLSLREQKGGSY